MPEPYLHDMLANNGPCVALTVSDVLVGCAQQCSGRASVDLHAARGCTHTFSRACCCGCCIEFTSVICRTYCESGSGIGPRCAHPMAASTTSLKAHMNVQRLLPVSLSESESASLLSASSPSAMPSVRPRLPRLRCLLLALSDCKRTGYKHYQ